MKGWLTAILHLTIGKGEVLIVVSEKNVLIKAIWWKTSGSILMGLNWGQKHEK